jgi:adenylate kinase family enzyme
MIISLFGPDGVGKTTAAKELGEQLDLPVISGTDISTWHDRGWHEYFQDKNTNESLINNRYHFITKIVRLHREAASIDEAEGGVIVDSDPLHKTFVHDYVGSRGQYDRTKRALIESFLILDELAGHEPSRSRLNVHVKLSRSGESLEHAQVLQQRIAERAANSIFDPTSVESSLAMIDGSNALEQTLRDIRREVAVIYSDEPDSLTQVL